MKRLLFALALSLPLLSLAAPSQAITITYSDKTQKVAPYFDFRGNYDLPFNLNINGYAAFAPDLSSFVSPIVSTSTGSDLASQIGAQIKWDVLADTNLNLGYNIGIFDLDLLLGHIKGSVTPYLGYRHMWTFTGNVNGNNTNTQAQGAHYGARFNLGLPLGFSGFAYAEASTLFGGSFERDGVSQALVTNGTTLPGFGLGVNWQLPFINLASAYVGYRAFFLPANLRRDPVLDGKLEMVNGLSLGLNFLFFGI
jgi:hypothetical protein